MAGGLHDNTGVLLEWGGSAAGSCGGARRLRGVGSSRYCCCIRARSSDSTARSKRLVRPVIVAPGPLGRLLTLCSSPGSAALQRMAHSKARVTDGKVTYPPGVKEISDKISKEEMVRRLKVSGTSPPALPLKGRVRCNVLLLPLF